MADRISWITYRGHKILRADYSGLQGDEFIQVINQVPAFYKGQPKGSVLSVTNVKGAFGTSESMSALKAMAKSVHEYDKKSAVLGISGVKRALLSTFNVLIGHSAKAFDNEQEALDWLVS